MSVDSAAKRFSMLNMRAPWMVRPLPIPDSSGWNNTQRYVGLNLYSGLAAAAPPAFTAAGYIGGTAVDAAGVMGTIFIDEGVPVPAGTVYISGFAHHQDGRRYVCPWPVSNQVFYFEEIARRSDGAMCIVTGGTVQENASGVAQTSRGEIIVSTSQPQLVHEGFGLRMNGALCVSDAS